MEKFVSFEKMSKKEQKKINSAQRRDWNGINPVTRVTSVKVTSTQLLCEASASVAVGVIVTSVFPTCGVYFCSTQPPYEPLKIYKVIVFNLANLAVIVTGAVVVCELLL